MKGTGDNALYFTESIIFFALSAIRPEFEHFFPGLWVHECLLHLHLYMSNSSPIPLTWMVICSSGVFSPFGVRSFSFLLRLCFGFLFLLVIPSCFCFLIAISHLGFQILSFPVSIMFLMASLVFVLIISAVGFTPFSLHIFLFMLSLSLLTSCVVMMPCTAFLMWSSILLKLYLSWIFSMMFSMSL